MIKVQKLESKFNLFYQENNIAQACLFSHSNIMMESE